MTARRPGRVAESAGAARESRGRGATLKGTLDRDRRGRRRVGGGRRNLGAAGEFQTVRGGHQRAGAPSLRPVHTAWFLDELRWSIIMAQRLE